MASDHLQGRLNLLGQATTPPTIPPAPGALEPQLAVQWGAFHQGIGSSVWALFSRSAIAKDASTENFFKDSWIPRRIPSRALVAAALWHVVFFTMPFPQVQMMPRKNPAFANVELTWSG